MRHHEGGVVKRSSSAAPPLRAADSARAGDTDRAVNIRLPRLDTDPRR